MATFKSYDDVTNAEITQAVSDWPRSYPLARHLSLWLAEHDYDWDPDLSNQANRAKFEVLLHRALEAALG